jgi:predicted Zn-dependent protease
MSNLTTKHNSHPNKFNAILLNNLIQSDNSNPYFYELKGQMLFESGQLAESIKSYDKALRMLPNSPLIQTSLAHALIEYNHTNNDVKKAIKLLNKSNIKNETPNNWQLLAKAYSLDNNMAYSYFSAAEFNRLIGNFDTAKKQIEKAKKLVKDKSLQLKISDFDEKIKSNIEKQQ